MSPTDRPEILRLIDRSYETWQEAIDDLPSIHILFLEEQCKLWKYTLARYYALQNKSLNDLPAIKHEESPIISKCEAYQRWMLGIRKRIKEDNGKNPALIQREQERCAQDICYWLTYYGWTHDPRLPEIGLLARTPFIPFPKQRELLNDARSWYENRQNGLIDKSREEGVSWLAMAFVTHNFLYNRGFSAILASEKEEKVDIIGSLKPLFGKIRYLIYHLPLWMRPTTFEKEGGQNDNFRRLINPANGCEITGEAGINIGRSGRCSVFVLDEAQEIEYPERVNSALESVTNCRIDIGTPNGMNHFGQRRHSGMVLTNTIHWYEDPRKNPEWRNGQPNFRCDWRIFKEATTDPVIIAQEHDIDYSASVSGTMIPSEWINAAVAWMQPQDGSDKIGGFDVAGGGKNESVYVMRVGTVASVPFVSNYQTSTEAAWDVVNKAEKDGITTLNYDMDGIGESLIGLFKTSDRKIPFVLNGVHGNARASDSMIESEGKRGYEKFRNKRAEVWHHLRKRFEKTFEHVKGARYYPSSELICIPNNPELIMQLSQPKMVVTQGGKIGVESKENMRSRGVKSPDMADALAYAFWDIEDEASVVSTFSYTSDSNHYCEFDVDLARAYGEQYAVLVQTPDMYTSVLSCLWDGRAQSKKLKVYGETVIPNATPDQVIGWVNSTMNPELMHIKEWVGNDELFHEIEKGKETVWNQYRRHKIYLKQNYFNDYRGAIMLVNTMFSNNMIQVHKRCNRLMLQLSNWTKKRGKPEDNIGLAMALCQIVTRLKIKKAINDAELNKTAYSGYDHGVL